MRRQVAWLLIWMLSGVVAGSMASAQLNEIDPPRWTLDSLSAVTDRSDITYEDNVPYYALLAQARDADPAELLRDGEATVAKRRAAAGLPTFPDMLQNPSAWRGEPVTLRGDVLQTIAYDAAPNPFGIAKLYEAALYTRDSQQHPTTVVFLDKPDNLPVGEKLVTGVRVSGYFFKVYRYPARDDKTRIAPLILARTVVVEATPAAAVNWRVVGAILAAGAVAAALLVWRQASDEKSRRASQRARLATPPTLTVDAPEQGRE